MPGKPEIEVEDTLNASASVRQWSDASVFATDEYFQPVKIVRVAVPWGSNPTLQVSGVSVEKSFKGLQSKPQNIQSDRKQVASEWVKLISVEEWRGFQFAKVEIYLARGNAYSAELLQDVTVTLNFNSPNVFEAEYSRESDMISTLALNGSIASKWWKLPVSKVRSDNLVNAWPQVALYRFGLEETGLYQLTGTLLRSRGVPIVGQPSNKVKLFGNSGKLLSNLPTSAADTMLMENAILVEDGGDGQFDEQDRILFFGKGLKGFDYCATSYMNGLAHHNPFTRENIYFLGVDLNGSDGLRMQSSSVSGSATEVTTTSSGEFVDDDSFIYSYGAPDDASGLVWYMSSIDGDDARSFSINLPNANGQETKLDLAGTIDSGGSSAFDIYFNNELIRTSYSFSDAPVTISPASVLPGLNVIRLVNRISRVAYLNYIEVQYQKSLTALSGTLQFNAPASQSGLFHYTLSGLNADAYILDVTNPILPRVARGISLTDSSVASSAKKYFALNSDRIRTPVFKGLKSQASLDYTLLRDPQNRAGVILLTYDDWYDELEPLKAFHESYREEPLPTMRVKLSDVYDEFGWGVRDVVAIRNFLQYAYENWRGSDGMVEPPRYVLFVGDGDYDYRNISSTADNNWMPPWESGPNATDDFFVEFGNGSLPQMLTGRWPVQNESELNAIVEKTISYAQTPLYGPWKNTATFAADDEYKNGCRTSERIHLQQAENLINNILPSYFTFKKIYENLYPVRITPTGPTKPDATRDLIETIGRGTLIVNYIGHGNERIWTDEQLFVMDRDRNLLDNPRTWPMFLAGTCTWGGYDRPVGRCYPEYLIADRVDGAIACLAATRLTYSGGNNDFTIRYYRELFRPGLTRKSFGEALLVGKSATDGNNASLYHVFGDPVLRLATPEYYAQVNARDDSMQALSLFHVSGFVSQDTLGTIWSDFNGAVEARVFDTEDSAAYNWCDDPNQGTFYYGLPGNAIFRGTATIQNGLFNIVFRVPRDVRFGGTNAKISLYFYGKSESSTDSADGIGIAEHLQIASESGTEQDSIPPQIGSWLEVPSFRSGDLVSSSPLLHVNLFDTSGINLSGAVGHKITVRIDDAQTEDLTPFFNYDRDSYTRGSLEKTIGPLSEGEHRIIIEAWDSFNNLNQISLNFVVGVQGTDGFKIKDVLNYPNPMKDQTYFTYFLTQEGTKKVSLKIFTLSGKQVYAMDGLDTRGPAFNSNSDRPWDGRDAEGHELANGVYFYRIKAEHTNGETAESTGKLVILR